MIDRQFLRFAAVGGAGFVVDAAILYAGIWWLGLGLYFGRVLSFLCAATFTWVLNRQYAFTNDRQSGLVSQWAKFLVANAFGALINFATYFVIVGMTAVGMTWPVLGVATGSIAGLFFNFTASKRWVFR